MTNTCTEASDGGFPGHRSLVCLQGIGTSIAAEVNRHLLSAYRTPVCLPATSGNLHVFEQWYQRLESVCGTTRDLRWILLERHPEGIVEGFPDFVHPVRGQARHSLRQEHLLDRCDVVQGDCASSSHSVGIRVQHDFRIQAAYRSRQRRHGYPVQLVDGRIPRENQHRPPAQGFGQIGPPQFTLANSHAAAPNP